MKQTSKPAMQSSKLSPSRLPWRNVRPASAYPLLMEAARVGVPPAPATETTEAGPAHR